MDSVRNLIGFVSVLAILIGHRLAMIPNPRSQPTVDDYDDEDIFVPDDPSLKESDYILGDLEPNPLGEIHEDSGNIKQLLGKLSALLKEDDSVVVYKPWSAGQHFRDQVLTTLPWMILSCVIGVVAGVCLWIIPIGFYKFISYSNDKAVKKSDEASARRSSSPTQEETTL